MSTQIVSEAPNLTYVTIIDPRVKLGDSSYSGANLRGHKDDYRLTERGRDFRSVLLAMLAWGNRHFTPEGASIQIVDARSGKVAEPILVDRATGRPIADPEYKLAAGPAATEAVRRRLAKSSRLVPARSA